MLLISDYHTHRHHILSNAPRQVHPSVLPYLFLFPQPLLIHKPQSYPVFILFVVDNSDNLMGLVEGLAGRRICTYRCL
jgi:hypothetical protein